MKATVLLPLLLLSCGESSFVLIVGEVRIPLLELLGAGLTKMENLLNLTFYVFDEQKNNGIPVKFWKFIGESTVSC